MFGSVYFRASPSHTWYFRAIVVLWGQLRALQRVDRQEEQLRVNVVVEVSPSQMAVAQERALWGSYKEYERNEKI